MVLAGTVLLLGATVFGWWVVRAPEKTDPVPPEPHAQLLFADDFDGNALDASKWTDRRGSEPYTYGSPFNPRLEDTYFEARQVRVADGILTLQAEPRAVRDDLGGARYSFVSGVVHTGDHFSFTYGYAEARIRVPDDAGYWPAFWMLPTPVDRDWPPEIDIAEFSTVVGSSRRPTFNVHWRDGRGDHQESGSAPYGTPGANYRGSWHTYALSWQPGRLQVFLDGEPGPIFEGDQVPDRPMYLILGMGVVRGKNPPPAAMEVDYVRVWSHG